MKSLLRTFPAILFTVFLLSCKEAPISNINRNGATVITLTNSSIHYQGLFDSEKYIDSVKWIKLETTKDNAISVISELFITDEWFIILDSKMGGILFFDHEGNYSHMIHKRGRGPQEYYSIGSLMIDELNKTVIVYDITQRKLISYDYNGNFKSSIEDFSDRHLARDIINLNTGGYICYRQDYSTEALSGVWKVDKNGKFDGYIYQITESYPLVMSDSRYALYRLPDNKIGLFHQHQADIYHIYDDSLHMKVRYELPGKIASNFAGQEIKTEDYYMIMSNHEKNGIILTEWSDLQNKGFKTLFSKATGQAETGSLFYPDFSGGFILPGRLVRNNTYNIFSMWTFPQNLTMYVQPETPDEVKNKVNILFEGMTDTEISASNPIIQLLYVKP